MTSSLRSREFTPKRELRLGKPCEGCLAEAEGEGGLLLTL